MIKKGSLQLSINAIVVIVLALTMLGIGISFTRGLFENADFSYTIDIPDPTSREPIQIAKDTLKFSTNGQTKLGVKVKNVGDQDIEEMSLPFLECFGDNNEVIIDKDSGLTGIGELVSPGSTAEYKLLIEIDDSEFSNGKRYACKIKMTYDGNVEGDVLATKPFFMLAQTT